MFAQPITEITTDEIQVDPTSKVVFYRMHEGEGLTLSDYFGNGPNATIDGAEGTIWTANPLWLTPNGTTTEAQDIISDYISSVMRMDDDFVQHIVSFDYYFDTPTDFEGIYGYGRSNSTAVGGYQLRLTASSQLQFNYAAVGGGQESLLNAAIGAYEGQRMTVTIQYRKATNELYLFVNGVQGAADVIVTPEPGIGANATYGLTLMDVATFEQPFIPMGNATADTRINNWMALKTQNTDLNLAAKINSEMYYAPHDIPWALDGA